MGSDGSVSMLGYWYPQFAVYDDVTGWQVDPYLATGEFYMDHADYDVRITVPAGTWWRPRARCSNPGAVLPAPVRDRLQRAARSFAAIPIVSDSVRRRGGATLQRAASLTWHFTADECARFRVLRIA